MSEWWHHNAKYTKAWLSYICIMWLIHVVVNLFLSNLYRFLPPLGVSYGAARFIMLNVRMIVWVIASFLVFRSAVRIFVMDLYSLQRKGDAEQERTDATRIDHDPSAGSTAPAGQGDGVEGQ